MKKMIVISAVWCPSCLILKKHLKKLKSEYNDIIFEILDYDLDDDVKSYNVGNTLPVIIIKDDDNVENRLIGEKSYQEVLDFLKKCDYL